MGFLSRHRSGKRPQLALRGESPGFSQVVAGSSRVTTGFSGTRSWGLREIQSPRVSRIAPQNSSAVTAGTEVQIWSGGQNLRVPLQGRHGSQGSSGAFTGESGPCLVWSPAILYPLEPEKRCQASCLVDHRDHWLSLKRPQCCHNCYPVLSWSSG